MKSFFFQAVSSSLPGFQGNRQAVILTTSAASPATSPFTYDSVRRELAHRTELVSRETAQLISRTSVDSAQLLNTRASLDSHMVSRSSLDSQDSVTQSLSSPQHQDHQEDISIEDDFKDFRYVT